MHYNNISCILDVCAWLFLWVLIGLDWVLPMMLLISHATCSFIFYAYFFFLNMHLNFVLSLSLSLSLSRVCVRTQIDCIMAPKQCISTPSRNPLHGFVSSSSDPSIPSHIRFCDEKAKTNFFRTSRPMAFIQNARSFCWISLTLRYLMLFWLRDGNLFVRNPCIVLSCLFKSFTPTYTVLISLFLNLLLHLEVHVS